MLFTRYGALSATHYKTNDRFKSVGYHTPPIRKGIFAFPKGYEESFLWSWKVDMNFGEDLSEEEYDLLAKQKYSKYIRENKKVFEYSGPIWCHFTGFIQGECSGSWVLTDMDTYKETLKKIKHKDLNSLHQTICSEMWTGKKTGLNKENIIIDPYKRGLGGFMSKDHLEVFIEKKHLGKIR